MERDIFYNTDKITRTEQDKLLRKAYSLCNEWWFDKLDCSVSFARQRIKDISFEDAMSHFVDGALMNIIHRRAVIPIDDPPYLEISFRSMEHPVDYFLWIIVDLKYKDEFIKGLVTR